MDKKYKHRHRISQTKKDRDYHIHNPTHEYINPSKFRTDLVKNEQVGLPPLAQSTITKGQGVIPKAVYIPSQGKYLFAGSLYTKEQLEKSAYKSALEK